MINKAIYKLLLFPTLLLLVLTNVSANNGIENTNSEFVLNVTIDKQDVRCFGEPQGIASAQVDGGLPPYDILWNTGQDNPVIDYLYAGVFSVTVTDEAGATATASVEINEPSAITLVSVEIIDENCDQENGAVLFSVEGGTPPYEYEWADGSEGQNLENASDGTYTVVVTDANNCFQKFGPYIIDSDCDPSGPCDDGPELTSASINESDCNLDNGSIFLSISNVAEPHTYQWTGGYDTEDLMNLAPGSYTLTLTDANDCSQEFGPYVIEEDCDIPCIDKPVVTSFVITNADCGEENGAIDITVDGGDPPFTFAWNTNPSQNTEDIENLAPGTYGVIITDTEGCDDKFSFEVKEDCNPEPPCVAPVIESVVILESTCGNAEGTVAINLVGGPAGYDFDWDPAVSNTFSAADLESGSYSVTITNVSDPDCSIIEIFSVGNSDGPQPTILSTTPASCNQNNGTAVLSDLTLTYVWDNGEVGNNPTMLTAGQHLVTVTDPATSCTNIIEVTIEEFTVLQASATINSQPTSGNADGSATINVTNGSLAYTYDWPDGPGPETRDDLAAGVYSVTVTDLGVTGCVVVVNFVLTNEGTGVTVTVVGEPTLDCIGDMNGTVDFTLTPPNADVTIVIIDMATGLPVNNGELTAGSYCMTATDNATGDIVGGDCFDLTQPSQIDVDFATFPQDCDGLGSIEVVDIMGGNGGYIYDWGDDVSGDPSDMNQYDLVAGDYTVTITDANGCSVVATIPVGEDGMPISVQTLNESPPTCPDSEDGSITVQGSGGTEPYTYTWNNVLGGSTSPNLMGGTTTLVITDANGCTTTQTYNLDPLGSLGNLTFPGDTIACADMVDFSAFATGADIYEWFDEDGMLIGSGPTVTLPVGVDPSEITIVASSNEGCTAQSSFFASGEALNVQSDTTMALVACADEPAPLDGLIVNPNPDYTYDWMPDNLIASGDGTPNPVFVSGVQGANQVSVEVTNSLGCSEILDFTIGVADPNIVPAQPQAEYDCQDYTVNLTIPNIYPGAIWDFGDNSPVVMGNDVTHTYNEPGDYVVTITFDPAIPCVDEITYPVNVLEALDNDVASTDENVCADTTVTLVATGANGSDLTWYDVNGAVVGMGETIDVQSGMPNVTGEMYIVEATNSFNCISTDTIYVTNHQILADPFELADLCEDEAGVAEVLLSGLSGEVNDIMWSTDSPDLTIENTANPEMVTYSNANDGDEITATLSNDFCTYSTSSIASVYNFDPELGVDVADVIADPIEIILGEEFDFEILNSGDLIITEEDNVINQDGLYSAIPDELGNITYTFIFEDPETGCSTTRSVTVTVVNPNCSAKNIFFPNLFTPNGDGMNDILYLRGTFVEEVFFTVYDRWGEKVFESNAIDQGWDGTFKGKELTNDVYGYYLRVRCDGEDYYQQGNVTLMR